MEKFLSDTNIVCSPAILEHINAVKVVGQKNFKLMDFYRDKGQPDGLNLSIVDDPQRILEKDSSWDRCDVPAGELNYYKLKEKFLEVPIIEALAGNNTIRNCLYYMGKLLHKQRYCPKEGVLLTGFRANIIYAMDYDGKLWEFIFRRKPEDSSWQLKITHVTKSRKVTTGDRVFSPTLLDT